MSTAGGGNAKQPKQVIEQNDEYDKLQHENKKLKEKILALSGGQNVR